MGGSRGGQEQGDVTCYAPEENMTLQWYIVSDPSICGGQPVIRGTRVLLRVILGHLAHGASVEDIQQDFPSLKAEHIRAVIAFAAASAAEDLPAPPPVPPGTWRP